MSSGSYCWPGARTVVECKGETSKREESSHHRAIIIFKPHALEREPCPLPGERQAIAPAKRALSHRASDPFTSDSAKSSAKTSTRREGRVCPKIENGRPASVTCLIDDL